MWKKVPTGVSALGVFVLAVAFSASGGGQAGAVGAAQTTATVSMTDYVFTPRDFTVFAGTTVVWRNDSPFTPHTSVSTNVTDPWDSTISDPTLAQEPGETFSHTFNVLGTFPYFCSLHQALLNMTGSITVVTPTQQIFLPILTREASPLQ